MAVLNVLILIHFLLLYYSRYLAVRYLNLATSEIFMFTKEQEVNTGLFGHDNWAQQYN